MSARRHRSAFRGAPTFIPLPLLVWAVLIAGLALAMAVVP